MDSILSDRNVQIGLVTVVIGLGLIQKPAVKRRCWERPHLGINNRLVYGQENLLREMRLSDPESFVSLMRISPKSFDKLLSIVGPAITQYSNREPINTSTRLAVTLRYLATGESAKSLSYTYRLGISTTDAIIKETLIAVYNNLKPLVYPKPTTEMWLKIAAGFNRRWNFPNCCGSLDGKHIRTRKPNKSGSDFWNYKKFHSTVMMAICDHEYKFVAVDTGCQGRNNDVVVLNHSKLGKDLMDGTLNLPGEEEIKFGPKLPHFLLADEIFGIEPYLITPYPGRGTAKLTYAQKIFNYRHGRGRRVIENTYGILANVWRVFHTEIIATPDDLDTIIMAAVCLHNFRIMENENNDIIERNENGKFKFQLQSIDEPDEQDELGLNATNSNQKEIGRRIRDDLKDYFISGGQVYWQDGLINKVRRVE